MNSIFGPISNLLGKGLNLLTSVGQLLSDILSIINCEVEICTINDGKTKTTYWNMLNGFNYGNASEIFNFIIESYVNSEFDKVVIIYNEFKNVAVQKSVVEDLLPISKSIKGQNENNTNYNFIFEPNKAKIIEKLIPQTLKTQLLKAVLESNASEQGSRMTAMSQATDNAGELLKELRLTYNRTRQAAITKEILEIVGGAEALNK